MRIGVRVVNDMVSLPRHTGDVAADEGEALHFDAGLAAVRLRQGDAPGFRNAAALIRARLDRLEAEVVPVFERAG